MATVLKRTISATLTHTSSLLCLACSFLRDYINFRVELKNSTQGHAPMWLRQASLVFGGDICLGKTNHAQKQDQSCTCQVHTVASHNVRPARVHSWQRCSAHFHSTLRSHGPAKASQLVNVRQKHHLLSEQELARVFPVSRNRSGYCRPRLGKLIPISKKVDQVGIASGIFRITMVVVGIELSN